MDVNDSKAMKKLNGFVATLRDDPGIAGSIKKEEEKDD